MTDETAHWVKEYRINAARMRERANAVSSPAMREQFEKIARELDHWADVEEATAAGDRSRT
jgi:hypothetical protein